MEHGIKKRKQLNPEKFVPNSVLRSKNDPNSLDTGPNTHVVSIPQLETPVQLARTSYTIQEPKLMTSKNNQRTRRTHTPIVNDTSPVLEKPGTVYLIIFVELLTNYKSIVS